MITVKTDRDPQNRLKLRATRLWVSADLDAASRDALEHACGDVLVANAGTDLLRHGTHRGAVHILLDGWAARYQIMKEGTRFISMLAVPGDICDPDGLRFDRRDYGLTMLSAGAVAVLPRQRADTLFASHPAIATAFWSLALAENSILTERAASIGRRSATQRVAHLLCELLQRLTVVGNADGQAYTFPLTQEHIADALGLTAVHVNRTMHTLRLMELVTVQNRRVTIHNWPGLSAFCGFQQGYLHLETVDEDHAPDLPAAYARDSRHTGNSFYLLLSITAG